MSLSLRQYARFLIIGALVGLFSLACRELIGRALGDRGAVYYSVSVIVAYMAGIVLSFLLNRVFTFGTSSSRGWSAFPAFVTVAGVGLVSTWLLSLLLRFALLRIPLGLDGLLGRYTGTAAFAAATLLSSAITYPLNALLVFEKRRLGRAL